MSAGSWRTEFGFIICTVNYQGQKWESSDVGKAHTVEGNRAETSLIAELVKNLPAMQEALVQFLVGKIPWRRDRLPTPVFLGSPCGSAGKESACDVGDLDLIPGLGRAPGEGKGYPLQYSGLENSMDCTVHGVPEGWTQLSDFHFQQSRVMKYKERVSQGPNWNPSSATYW